MNEIASKINRRRRQILVHSIMYYRLGDSIISDFKWQAWANELHDLQEQHPEVAKNCIFAKEFEGFDASTGFHLPLGDPHYRAVAEWLLAYSKKRRNE